MMVATDSFDFSPLSTSGKMNNVSIRVTWFCFFVPTLVSEGQLFDFHFTVSGIL